MVHLTQILRRFNRTYTQRIGALDESFLGTGRPLATSRLLFEIGDAGGEVGLAVLRSRLGLDDGYLARLLRRLETDGLVTTYADEGDRRRRLAALSTAGVAAYAELEERSEGLAATLLAPLTARQQARLADALATADLLVRAATVELTPVEPDDPIATEAVGCYFAELAARFPDGFDPGDPDPRDERATYLVACSDGVPVAYGGLRPLGDGVVEVKRMWVADEWRGAGLGSRMLRELEALAGRLGHTRVVLDTHGSLTEALTLYDRAGYERIDRYNDNPYAQHFFAKTLTRRTPTTDER